MEEKELTEQESLALISQMIKKTNKQMRTGSGDFLLAWGWVLTLVPLAVSLLVLFTNNGMWMWGYFAIFVIGYPTEWLMNRKKKNDGPHVKTYMEEVIDSVWKCISEILFAYAVMTVGLIESSPFAWLGMWTLGMLMPTFGSIITGVILKVKAINISTTIALGVSLMATAYLWSNNHLQLWMLFAFPFVSVCSMVIPGYLINRQAKRFNAE